MNDKQLVFGSKEAQEILEKQKQQEKINGIKKLVNSAIYRIDEASELVVSVSASVEDIQEVEKSVWELIDVINTLMIDMGMRNYLSGTIENATETIDNLIHFIESVANNDLANEDIKSALELLKLPSKTKKAQTNLGSLLHKFSY